MLPHNLKIPHRESDMRLNAVIVSSAIVLSVASVGAYARGGGGGHSSGGHSSGYSSSSHSSSSHTNSGYSSSHSSSVSPGTGAKSQSTQVHGYTRKNGTYVAPARRTTPDKDFRNNYSTKGNVNPYTGKAGTRVEPPKKK
jgi:hypothetical protein